MTFGGGVDPPVGEVCCFWGGCSPEAADGAPGAPGGPCCGGIGTGTAPAGGAVVLGGAGEALSPAAAGVSLGVSALTEEAGEESAEAFLPSAAPASSDLASLLTASSFESFSPPSPPPSGLLGGNSIGLKNWPQISQK